MTMALEKELETYHNHLAELVGDAGKYVVVFGDQILGTYHSYEDALQAGYEKAGMTPFLVKKIQADEQVQYFTREILAV